MQMKIDDLENMSAELNNLIDAFNIIRPIYKITINTERAVKLQYEQALCLFPILWDKLRECSATLDNFIEDYYKELKKCKQ